MCICGDCANLLLITCTVYNTDKMITYTVKYPEILALRGDRGSTVWLRCCTTNRKFAGSIPDGVIGIFH